MEFFFQTLFYNRQLNKNVKKVSSHKMSYLLKLGSVCISWARLALLWDGALFIARLCSWRELFAVKIGWLLITLPLVDWYIIQFKFLFKRKIIYF